MYCNNDVDYLHFLQDKQVYIFGAGIVGRRLCAGIEKAGCNVAAFIDNKKSGTYCDKPVIRLEQYQERAEENAFIVISSNKYESTIKMQLLNQKIYNFISVSQIDFGGGENYYDEAYFAFQKPLGEFGGKVSARLFSQYVAEDDVLVEFGSGGGYLLRELRAKEKVGIEINDFARQNAEMLGVSSVKHICDIPCEYADTIISTNVLEHVENPLGILRDLHHRLKEGGKAVFVVPNESCETEYTRSEINNHLYTWNCLNIGNLFKAAGYFVHSVSRIQEVWPSNYIKIAEEVSPTMFDLLAELGGAACNESRCLIVAYK